MRRIRLLTIWREGKLVCCCPPEMRCSKPRDCEEEEFFYNPYEGLENCMKERSYQRNSRGAITQR